MKLIFVSTFVVAKGLLQTPGFDCFIYLSLKQCVKTKPSLELVVF